MHHYTQGLNTKQAHKAIPEGHFEEEQGLGGFFGPVSHLIRKKPTTRWKTIEGPLKPRLFDLVKLSENDGRQRLFYNSAMTVLWQWCDVDGLQSQKSYKNADGDLLYFCHKGRGQLFTEYGLIDYRPGQYLVIPKCINHTLRPSEKSVFLVVENKTSHYQEPQRGMVGRHAVYDINTIDKPDLSALQSALKEQAFVFNQIEVKHRETITRFEYEDCVYSDVVGWKGDLFPFGLHVDNMMPLGSHRAHLPPSAHTTFVARDFVVCTFLPRPLESDEDALKVPFYHQNIDYDEILFYHDGNFFSRDNLHAGMLSFHPAGFSHGPHPKAIQNVTQKKETDEYAVMIDSRWPLERDDSAQAVEVQDYWKSWQK